MTRYTRKDISNGLRRLGLKPGDIVQIMASLRAMGEIDENRSSVLIHAVLDVIGPEGTMLGLAFNRFVMFPELHKEYVVNLHTQPISGGLAATMVN